MMLAGVQRQNWLWWQLCSTWFLLLWTQAWTIGSKAVFFDWPIFLNAESTYWSNPWIIKQLQYPQLNDPQFFLIKMFLEFVPPIETVFCCGPPLQMWSDRCHHASWLLSAAWQQRVELGGIRCHCFGCVWKWGYPADTPSNGHFNGNYW